MNLRFDKCAKMNVKSFKIVTYNMAFAVKQNKIDSLQYYLQNQVISIMFDQEGSNEELKLYNYNYMKNWNYQNNKYLSFIVRMILNLTNYIYILKVEL